MKYHIFLLAGRDSERREIMKVLDPKKKYKSKVLFPMFDKTVLEWVVEEYSKSPYVEKLCIVGLSEEDIQFNVPVEYVTVDPFAPLSQKYVAGLEYLEKNNLPKDKIIFSSSDCPGVKVETLNYFLEEIETREGYDFILSVIPLETVEESFPDSKRGVARLKDMNLTQGELALFSPYAIRKHVKTVDSITTIRKKRGFWPLFWYVAKRPMAWSKLFKIAIGRGTLKDAIIAFSRAFKLKSDVIIIKDAGLSLDMDLPEDYDKLKNYVEKVKIQK
ncbi:MAG: hypothetical protein GOP50_10610 [Candidatus Heimdallarchaeota archaeon]|nr:hypothetical protein [Candidatus Heimdallarchaeota archaeon]